MLELCDPLTTSDTVMAGRYVPLESDLTTPLAYFLSRPEMGSLATIGLLQPDELLELRPGGPQPIMGLYMVQPYRARQDSGADGPRAVVEPDDLDGDVQRSAQPAGDSQTATNSGSISIRAASRFGSAPPSCAAIWPKPARRSIPATRNRRSTRWC